MSWSAQTAILYQRIVSIVLAQFQHILIPHEDLSHHELLQTRPVSANRARLLICSFLQG